MKIEFLSDSSSPQYLPIDGSLRRDLNIFRLKDENHKDASLAVSGSNRIFLSTNVNPTQEGWQVLTAESKTIDGKWENRKRVRLNGVEGPRLCAPGVVYDEDDKLFHMFIQTECFDVGGKIFHLTSESGISFEYKDVALESVPGTSLAGIYDSEPALIINDEGKKEYYMTFTGVEGYQEGRAKGGAIYLAKSENRWEGPWTVFESPLFNEDQIPEHLSTRNGGEWVPEGGKIVQTGSHEFWFYGVCFTKGEEGNRQRGFLAVADDIKGPWKSLGLLAPKGDKGETGHGTISIEKGKNGSSHVTFLHQAREMNGPWHIESSEMDLGVKFGAGLRTRLESVIRPALAWI